MRSGKYWMSGLCAVASTIASAGELAPSPALDSAVPDALVGQDGAIQRGLARYILGTLPAEQRRQIQASPDAGPWERSGPQAGAALIGENAEYERLSAWVSPELYARMTEQQLNLFRAQLDAMDNDVSPVSLCFAPGTDPEFAYAINEILEFRFQISFQQTNRWSNTASGTTGTNGTPITLTYSFVPDGTPIPDLGIGLGSGSSVLFAWLNSRYGSQSTWKPLFDQTFERWGELIGVTYVYEPNDDGATMNSNSGVLGTRGDVRIGAFNYQNDGNGGVLGYNNFPNDGDMVLDAYDSYFNSTSSNSLRLRNVIAHEHGHGLGMLHVCPITQTKLMEPFASNAFDGPQLDDILNGQRYYGDINEPNAGPSVATDLGSISVGSIASQTEVSLSSPTDSDYYKITATQPITLNALVSPAGATYRQGPQTQTCSSGSLTNYNEIQDLRLTILNGTTFQILGSFDNSGIGDSEIANVEVPAGPHYIVVNGSGINTVQIYNLVVNATPSSIGPCNDADIAEPYETLNIDDVLAFLDAFASADPSADVAAPTGTFNIDDVLVFLNAFAAGCP